MTDTSSVALIPRAEREVTFYGDVLLIAIVGDIPYVAIRPIADFIGLDWSSQRQLEFLERWRKTALKDRPDQGNLF